MPGTVTDRRHPRLHCCRNLAPFFPACPPLIPHAFSPRASANCLALEKKREGKKDKLNSYSDSCKKKREKKVAGEMCNGTEKENGGCWPKWWPPSWWGREAPRQAGQRGQAEERGTASQSPEPATGTNQRDLQGGGGGERGTERAQRRATEQEGARGEEEEEEEEEAKEQHHRHSLVWLLL